MDAHNPARAQVVKKKRHIALPGVGGNQAAQAQMPGRANPITRRKINALNAGGIQAKLPPALGNWINHEVQGSALEVEADRGSGFNTLSWHDQQGKKLYLKNLSATGDLIEDQARTFTDLMNISEQNQIDNLPNQIIIQTHDSPAARLKAKRTILDYTQFVRGTGKTNNREIYIVRESGVQPLANNEVGLQYTIRAIQRAEAVYSQEEFTNEMGSKPKDDVVLPGVKITLRSKSSLYKDILRALNTYHEKLAQVDVPEPDPAPDAFGRMPNGPKVKARKRAELDIAAQELIDSLDAYIKDSSTNKLDNKKKESKANKKDAVATLKAQITTAVQDNFKEQMDLARFKRWSTIRPAPLNDEQIVPGSKQRVGQGAQGEVFKYLFQPDGQPAFEAVVKLDDNNYLNQNAIFAGIPENNPQQSARAIAAHKLSAHIGLDIIPRTDQYTTIDDDGHIRLGQALEFVRGSVGQKKVLLRNLALDAQTKAELDRLQGIMINGTNQEKAQARLAYTAHGNIFHDVHGPGQNYYPKAPIDAAQTLRLDGLLAKKLANGVMTSYELDELDKFEKDNNVWYHAVNRPVAINYNHEVVQKGLSDLQVFDYIIGHADRNPGNWIYIKDAHNNITGVRGIDNDDSFGQRWVPKGTTGDPNEPKTPDVPPVVDVTTAIKILNLDLGANANLLAGLSPAEITAARDRLQHVKDEIITRARAGHIAVLANEANPNGQLATLRLLVNGQNGAPLPALRNWGVGANGATALHDEQNSYLGSQMAQAGPLNANAVADVGGVVFV